MGDANLRPVGAQRCNAVALLIPFVTNKSNEDKNVFAGFPGGPAISEGGIRLQSLFRRPTASFCGVPRRDAFRFWIKDRRRLE